VYWNEHVAAEACRPAPSRSTAAVHPGNRGRRRPRSSRRSAAAKRDPATPRIVEVLDFGRMPTDQAYIAMDSCCAARDVTIPRPPRRARRLARGPDSTCRMLAGSTRPHLVGVIHREPQARHVIPRPRLGRARRDRVKISTSGIAKLTGAGARRPARSGRDKNLYSARRLHGAGAPEQCPRATELDRAPTLRVGCLPVRAVTGRPARSSPAAKARSWTMHIYEPPTADRPPRAPPAASSSTRCRQAAHQGNPPDRDTVGTPTPYANWSRARVAPPVDEVALRERH